MKYTFELNLLQLLLLYFAAGEIGAVASLMAGGNVTPIAGLVQLLAMLLVTVSVLLGAKKKRKAEKDGEEL